MVSPASFPATAERLASSVAVPVRTRRPERAVELALDLMKIAGPSCQELPVIEFLSSQLMAAGLPEDSIVVDDAHQRSPAGGECGNLIVKLPGTLRAPRRMLMAHVDTMAVCVGSDPVFDGEDYVSGNPGVGIGADNRSGVAVVLSTALEILERRLPHPPLTLFFPVQEELGLYGSRYVRRSLLGKPSMAFNWDAYGAHRITVAATGSYAIQIHVHGIASHAGGAPECGVSAIAIAALAMSDLVRRGWHGDIRRGKLHGTANFGLIHGGTAVNTVPDLVTIAAEARSHDAEFRREIVRQMKRAFRRAALKLANDEGARGSCRVHAALEFQSFRLDEREPVVEAAANAIRAAGHDPEIIAQDSGLDANWTNAHGIPTVTLGAGQARVHTPDELFDPQQFERACRIALHIATAGQA